jgi:hypothetical protein
LEKGYFRGLRKGLGYFFGDNETKMSLCAFIRNNLCFSLYFFLGVKSSQKFAISMLAVIKPLSPSLAKRTKNFTRAMTGFPDN